MRKIVLFAWGLFAALLCAQLSGCGASGTGSGATNLGGMDEVVFSMGSEDVRNPKVMMKVMAGERNLFYGPVVSAEPAEYVYTSCRIDSGDLRLWVMSEVDGEVVETEKVIAVRPHTWVVITRLRNLDDEPEMRIEVSYETGDVWKRVGTVK